MRGPGGGGGSVGMGVIVVSVAFVNSAVKAVVVIVVVNDDASSTSRNSAPNVKHTSSIAHMSVQIDTDRRGALRWDNIRKKKNGGLKVDPKGSWLQVFHFSNGLFSNHASPSVTPPSASANVHSDSGSMGES